MDFTALKDHDGNMFTSSEFWIKQARCILSGRVGPFHGERIHCKGVGGKRGGSRARYPMVSTHFVRRSWRRCTTILAAFGVALDNAPSSKTVQASVRIHSEQK